MILIYIRLTLWSYSYNTGGGGWDHPTDPNPGGGGGGGGYSPDPEPEPEPEPPGESQISPLCDPELTEKMEALLSTLKSSKLGASLMEKINLLLEGTTNNVYLIYTNKRPEGSEATDLGRTFYGKDGDVYCYMFTDDLLTAYEELGHAFQSKNYHHEISIHREMEVKMMGYDFYKENKIEPFGNERDWETINKFSYGKTSEKRAKKALNRLGYDTSNFNSNTFHTKNLKELRN